MDNSSDPAIMKMFTTMTGITAPLFMAINALGGVTAMVWLIIINQWKLVIFGVGVVFIMPLIIIPILMIPNMALAGLGVLFIKNKKYFLSDVFTWFGLVYILCMILYLNNIVISTALSLSNTNNDSIAPYILWGYTIITTPFVFSSSKEPDNIHSAINTYFVQLSYVIVAILYLLKSSAVISLIIVCGLIILLIYFSSLNLTIHKMTTEGIRSENNSMIDND